MLVLLGNLKESSIEVLKKSGIEAKIESDLSSIDINRTDLVVVLPRYIQQASISEKEKLNNLGTFVHLIFSDLRAVEFWGEFGDAVRYTVAEQLRMSLIEDIWNGRDQVKNETKAVESEIRWQTPKVHSKFSGDANMRELFANLLISAFEGEPLTIRLDSDRMQDQLLNSGFIRKSRDNGFIYSKNQTYIVVKPDAHSHEQKCVEGTDVLIDLRASTKGENILVNDLNILSVMEVKTADQKICWMSENSRYVMDAVAIRPDVFITIPSMTNFNLSKRNKVLIGKLPNTNRNFLKDFLAEFKSVFM